MPILSSKSLRIAIAVLVSILALSCAALFSRMGGIEVHVNESSLPPLNADVSSPSSIAFRVCTYNVQARPLFDETKNKFAGISPLLNQFDFCGIQECFKDHTRLWKWTEHPVRIYHSRLKHPLKMVGSGLSILGKYPLLETQAINFNAKGEFQNKPASKGVLMARFQVRDMMLDFYTTHIEAGRSPQALRAREGQGEEIIEFIRKHSPEDHTVIFVGDFNMRPSRGPEDKEKNKNNARVFVFDRMVEQLQFRDASDEFNGPIGTEIDRILFRPGTGCTMKVMHWQKDTPEFYQENGKSLSDHKPVFAEFELRKHING